MKRLDKQASRQRWRELRDLWNEYDPIGVMGGPDSPQDEYEAYVGQTMRLLEQGANAAEIKKYLRTVSQHMGLRFGGWRAKRYSNRFVRWYQERWRDTIV